jgi:predicted amidophosphoribosyltransferase
MVAELKEAPDGTWYCSNCRMRANVDETYCPFCGYEWSNWEEIQHRFWEIYFKDLTSIGN